MGLFPRDGFCCPEMGLVSIAQNGSIVIGPRDGLGIAEVKDAFKLDMSIVT